MGTAAKMRPAGKEAPGWPLGAVGEQAGLYGLETVCSGLWLPAAKEGGIMGALDLACTGSKAYHNMI